jgi:hypothetical protein
MPAVEGGFHRNRQNRTYLPLTDEVITAHLTGTIHAGIYPLMSDDRCRLLACDLDGSGALLDALAYTKAARAADVPTALEISRSGTGAHVWSFFSDAVEATLARRIGAGLLHEAIAMRGELDLSSYDRFFPSQDYLPRSGSIGNLIALPMQGLCRRRGTTVFLDLATLEPHADQFGYLSQVERITPKRAAALAEAPTSSAGASSVLPRSRTSGVYFEDRREHEQWVYQEDFTRETQPPSMPRLEGSTKGTHIPHAGQRDGVVLGQVIW